jgi:hypothetical protein
LSKAAEPLNNTFCRSKAAQFLHSLFMKATATLIAIVVLAFCTRVKAADFTGSMDVVVDPFTVSTSFFTTSSFSLNQANLVTVDESGTFAALVPTLGDFTAYTGTVSGLSTSPVAESISDFFVFSTPDTTLSTSGTTPSNRFDFNLSSITETTDTGSTASFQGYGTLVDTLGTLTSTPATFDIAYSSQHGYTITLAAVPEPSTWVLLLGGLSLFALRIRARRA